MKKLVIFLSLIAITVTGCKTTESNYRAAYEIAAQKKNESAVDSATLAKIDQTDLPKDMTVEGVTLPVRTFPVGYPEGGGASREVVKRYNIVVGHFKQIFNAKAMRERLVTSGYEGAMILNDKRQNFYVISSSVATPSEAAAELDKVRKDPSIHLKQPLPWVLRPAHLAR